MLRLSTVLGSQLFLLWKANLKFSKYQKYQSCCSSLSLLALLWVLWYSFQEKECVTVHKKKSDQYVIKDVNNFSDLAVVELPLSLVDTWQWWGYLYLLSAFDSPDQWSETHLGMNEMGKDFGQYTKQRLSNGSALLVSMQNAFSTSIMLGIG